MLRIKQKSVICAVALLTTFYVEKSLALFDGPFDNCEIIESPGPKGICSGHGSCINNTCSCKDGFTGLSDFINTEGLDCQINELAIKCIWGALLLVLFIGQVRSLPKMYERYADFREVQQDGKMNGRRIPITSNKGVLAIVLYEGVMVPSLIAMIVTKLVADNERIGVTFTVTFLFFLTKAAFYGSAMLFQPALVAALMRAASFGTSQSGAVERLIRFNNISSFFNWMGSSLLGILPFVTYANGGKWDETAEIVWFAYLGGSVFTLSLYALQCTYLKNKINEVLTPNSAGASGSGREKMEQTKKMLIKLQNETIFQVVLNCTIYIAFIAVPLMWNRHDYYLPLSWIAFVILGKKLADTHVSSGSSKKKVTKLVSGSIEKTGSFTTIQDSRVEI
uniref:Epidermal growth factor-like domain-containing protein n=1 Tax=Aplanochytrium stocchinoi TaxID=215587 RepID=A0A7S3LQM8_9STRA|mmetsp:Transcript_17510/g.22304  ORF Transcript_17510/g.22304 Transcript_17510/m.22304 type:complete len:393 (+) Transcript_17510:416-1594(+)